MQRVGDCSSNRIAQQGAHQEDVVVDGLGHADDAAHDAICRALLLDGVGARIAAVAAHHKENVDAPHVYALDNLPGWMG